MFRDEIFRAYDIRGRPGIDFDESFPYQLGLALGKWLKPGSVSVSRDVRETGEDMKRGIIEGLVDSGRDVVDIGMNPTPLMYFSIPAMGLAGGVQVTASHLPAEWNGVKMNDHGMMPIDAVNGIFELRDMIRKGVPPGAGKGKVSSGDVRKDYIDRLSGFLKQRKGRKLKVIIDNGNGSVGRIAEQIFRNAGFDAETLYPEPDGSFPNHVPEPHREGNMKDSQRAVVDEGADLGIAFDGDGDRAGFVDSEGRTIPMDRVLMLFAEDALSRRKGKVVVEVRASMALLEHIKEYGGEPVMEKAGRSYIVRAVKREDAVFGGELTGHLFFPLDYFMFDDGIFAGVKMAEIFSRDENAEQRIWGYREYLSSPEFSIKVGDDRKWEMVEEAGKLLREKADRVVDIDGIRAEWDYGWILVRASNTGPKIKGRFEARDGESYEYLKSLLDEVLERIGAK